MKNCMVVACSVFLIALTAPALAWYESGYYPGPPEPPTPPEPPGRYEPYTPPVPEHFGDRKRARVHIEKDRYEQGYLLRVYTQGIEPDDIEIRADRGRLRLRTAIAEQRDWQNQEPYRRSRLSSYTRIARSVRLPYDADPRGLETSVTDNVLEIRIPRMSYPAPEPPPPGAE